MANPYEAPQSPGTDGATHREPSYRLIAAVVVVGMSLLGIAAMMAQWLKEGWLFQWRVPYDAILTLALCGTIGAVVGVVSIPFVAPRLLRHDWLLTAAKIYGTNMAFVVAYVLVKPTGLTGPLSAAVVAFMGVVGMAQWFATTTQSAPGGRDKTHP